MLCCNFTWLFLFLDDTRDEYFSWLENFRGDINAPNHKTSPIVWFEEGSRYLGGRDDTIAWIKKQLSVTGSNFDDVAYVNSDRWNPE